MITNSGGGFSKKGETMIYRWKEDATCDSNGMFFYIKNINSGDFWSSSCEPCKVRGDSYEVVFSQNKAEFDRKDGNITTHTEVTVSQEDNAEIRKITLINNATYSRLIEVTSYSEVTLTNMDSDLVHPAFSNLFIKTEYLENPECIIASRRPRAKNDKKNWVMHTVAVQGETVGKVKYETSRSNFIGRCRNLETPHAMDNETPLKNTVGAVLDPILSLRVRVKIESGKSCTMSFTTGISDSKEKVLELARKYCDFRNISRIFELSWTQSLLELKYLGIKSTQANLYQTLGTKIIYQNETLRSREINIKNISRDQSDLWCYGISGDIPIVLAVLENSEELDYLRQMITAQEYLSNRGLRFDLVVLNKQEASYIQNLQDSVRDLISSGFARDKQNKSGGIFMLNSSTIPLEDVNLLMAISRLVIDFSKGSLMSHIKNINCYKRLQEDYLSKVLSINSRNMSLKKMN